MNFQFCATCQAEPGAEDSLSRAVTDTKVTSYVTAQESQSQGQQLHRMLHSSTWESLWDSNALCLWKVPSLDVMVDCHREVHIVLQKGPHTGLRAGQCPGASTPGHLSSSSGC